MSISETEYDGGDGQIPEPIEPEWDYDDDLSSGEALAAIAAAKTFEMCPETKTYFEQQQLERMAKLNAMTRQMGFTA